MVVNGDSSWNMVFGFLSMIAIVTVSNELVQGRLADVMRDWAGFQCSAKQ